MRISTEVFAFTVLFGCAQMALGMSVTIGGQETSSVGACQGIEVTFSGAASKSDATPSWNGATPVSGQPWTAKKTYNQTGTYTVKLTATKGSFSGTATCTVTVTKAVWISCGGNSLIAYAAGVPDYQTLTATAVVCTSGGTFLWTGDSKIGIVGAANESSVTFRGLTGGDGKIKVTYTVNNKTFSDEKTIRVRVPTRTDSTADGASRQVAGHLVRVYYHIVYDQYGINISRSLPVEEIVTPPHDGTSPGEISYWGPDGNWQGGYAVKDSLSIPMSEGSITLEQKLKVAGHITTPDYTISSDGLEVRKQ